MKKIAFVLSLVMMLSVFAACGNSAENETTAPIETTVATEPSTEPATEPETEATEGDEFVMPEADAELASMFEKLYENVVVELPLMTMPVDLADEYARTTYLGGASEGITEALVSESMMGSQAFSISLVRTESNEAAKAVAQTMFDNIDTRKWICVEATDKMAASYGNLAVFIMVDPEMGATAEQLMNGFATVFGGEITDIIK